MVNIALIKKNCLLLAFFIAISTINYSCSSDNEPLPIIKNSNYYAFVDNLSKYGLVGHIKTMEHIDYSYYKWDNEDQCVKKGNIHKKIIYSFDTNGVLTGIKNYYWNTIRKGLVLSSLTSYNYDKKYRLTLYQIDNYVYRESIDSVEHWNTNRSIIEYNDTKNIARWYQYKQFSDADPIAKYMNIYQLDVNGRINEDYLIASYYQNTSSFGKNMPKEINIQDNMVLNDTKEIKLYEKKDSNGNILVSYDYQIDHKEGSESVKSIHNYWEQVITYFDGQALEDTSTTTNEKPLTSNKYEVEHLTHRPNDTLRGQVKSLMTDYYYNVNGWNGKEVLTIEYPYQSIEEVFDRNGVKVIEKEFNRIDGSQPSQTPPTLYQKIEIEYDSLFRITYRKNTYYGYSFQNHSVCYTYCVEKIDYDELNKKAIVFEYNWSDEVPKPNSPNKQVIFKLTNKLKIDEGWSEEYISKQRASMLINDFESTPYKKYKYIERIDDKGNSTEKFRLVSIRDSKGNYSTSQAEDYIKRTILYY